MEYKELIDGINSGSIKRVEFSVQGYSHYRHCCIYRETAQSKKSGNPFSYICIDVSKEKDEKYINFHKFDESQKLFVLKNQGGSLSLKQAWSRIVIEKIEYMEN